MKVLRKYLKSQGIDKQVADNHMVWQVTKAEPCKYEIFQNNDETTKSWFYTITLL